MFTMWLFFFFAFFMRCIQVFPAGKGAGNLDAFALVAVIAFLLQHKLISADRIKTTRWGLVQETPLHLVTAFKLLRFVISMVAVMAVMVAFRQSLARHYSRRQH
jgi:hypothetical protein